MYHLTTDTGLNVTTPDALDAVEALRAELHQRIAQHPITWTIEVDGISQETAASTPTRATTDTPSSSTRQLTKSHSGSPLQPS